MKIYYSICACLFLAGCGGGEPKRPEPAPATRDERVTLPPAAAPEAIPADPRPVIVAFGDSLTAGFGADPGMSYPDFLQKDVDARNLRYRVVNSGISGNTTTDGLERIQTVLALHPAVVILEFGGNDGLRGLPVSTTRANMEQMVLAFRKARAKIVLAGMTLPPNYGPDYIHSFEAVYRDLSRQYRLPLIPFLLEGVGGNPPLMQRDGIHATAEGNRIVAENVMRALAPIL